MADKQVVHLMCLIASIVIANNCLVQTAAAKVHYPVSISKATSKSFSSNSPALNFATCESEELSAIYVSNHSLTNGYANGSETYVSGAILNNEKFKFTFVQLMWNITHTPPYVIDGKQVPDIKVSWLFYNEKYSNASEAAKHENSVVVLTHYVKIEGNDNKAFEKLGKLVNKTKEVDGSVTTTLGVWLEPFKDIFFSNSNPFYYVYFNSFHTEKWNSIITVVFPRITCISERQYDYLKSDLNGHTYTTQPESINNGVYYSSSLQISTVGYGYSYQSSYFVSGGSNGNNK